MRAVYFDCFAGVSGDMIVGAQLDLGVDLELLRHQMSSLGLGNYEITSKRVERGGLAATKFDVRVDETRQPARKLADIRSIVLGSTATDRVKRQAIRVFERLAEAEARVHGTTSDEVHFHEVGAVDSIIDIVAATIGFELLGVEQFFCSALRMGNGSVSTQHGQLPIPAPATAELLRGAPIYGGQLEGEFVTPTGAAIVATFCEEFGPLPQMKVARAGYGAGQRDPKGFPNALRLLIGDMDESQAGSQSGSRAGSWRGFGSEKDETIVVIETNIDDMNPQVYAFVTDLAFGLGALDAFVTPAQMKKGRPGVLLTVLSTPEVADELMAMLLVETTTLGVRYYEAQRRVLERAIETVETEYGPVRVKVARDGARTLHFQPEHEDCVKLAVQAKVPLLEVHGAATAAYRNKVKK